MIKQLLEYFPWIAVQRSRQEHEEQSTIICQPESQPWHVSTNILDSSMNNVVISTVVSPFPYEEAVYFSKEKPILKFNTGTTFHLVEQIHWASHCCDFVWTSLECGEATSKTWLSSLTFEMNSFSFLINTFVPARAVFCLDIRATHNQDPLPKIQLISTRTTSTSQIIHYEHV